MATIKRNLPSLTPNDKYLVRVRSYNSFGVPSEWSEGLLIQTPGDESVPNPPTGLVASFVTPELVVAWTPPTANSDSSILNDFKHYRVTLVDTTDMTSKSYEVTGSFFTLPYAQNLQDFGASPSFNISVRTVDTSDNPSLPATTSAVNATPLTPPDGPTLVPAFTLISVSMAAAPSDQDIIGYDLYHSTSPFGPFTLLSSLAGSSYTHEVAQGTTHYYQFKSRDIFGQLSPGFSPITSATSLSLDTADTTPPDDITGLTITDQGFNPTTQRSFIEVSWDASINSDLAYYELRIKPDSDVVYSSVVKGVGFTTHRFNDLLPDTNYTVQIRALDLSSNQSNWTPAIPLAFTTVTDNTAPATPTGQTATGKIESIFVRWNQNTETDFARYRLYASQTPGFTPNVGTNMVFTGNATSYVLATTANQAWYFRLTAVDVTGNESVPTAQFTATSTASFVPDAVPPAVPTGLTLTTGQEFNGAVENVYINASWTAPADSDLAGYSIRIRKGAETRYTYQTTVPTVTSAKFTSLQPNTSYGVQVAAFDKSGNYSAYTAESTLVAVRDVGAPAQTTGLSLTGGVRSLILQWTANTEVDLDHYEIHVGTTAAFTANSTNLYSKPAQGTVENITKYYNGSSWVNLIPGTTYYVKMRAVDVSGNLGTMSAEVNATTGYVLSTDIGFSIGGGNLVRNSGFQDSASYLTGWTNSGASSSVAGRASTVAVRITSASYGYVFQNVAVPVGTYVISCWTKFNTATSTQFAGLAHEFSGGAVGTVIATTNQGLAQSFTQGVWIRQSRTLNVTTAGNITILGTNSYGGTATGSVDVDDFQIEAGDVLTAYAPKPDEILSGTITATEIADNAVTTPKIIAGAVVAGKVAAGAINTEHLTVGSISDNAILNSSFEDESVATAGQPSQWRRNVLYNNTTTHARASSQSVSGSWSHAIAAAATTSEGDILAKSIPVVAGELWFVSTQYKSLANAADGLYFRIYFGTTQDPVSFPPTYTDIAADIATTTSWQLRQGQVTVPVGMTWMTVSIVWHRPSTATTLYIDDVVARKVTGSAQIADASIITAKIADATITSAKIFDLVADKITTGSLLATVTVSGTIRTATSNARMEMTSTGMIGYATDGVTKNFEYKNSDGSVSLVGNLTVGSNITGATITGGTFQTNLTPTTNGIIIEDTNGFRAYQSGVLRAQITRLGAATFDNILITNVGKSSGFIVNAGNFTVDWEGNVTAADITATGGQIGGTDISATKLTGGIIEGSQFDIANAGSVNFTGSGKMTWGVGATGGIELANSGYINNAAYRTDNTTGFSISNSGIIINQGTIKAAAIQIGISNENLLSNASFENGTTVATSWAGANDGTVPTYTIDNTQSMFQSKSQKMVAGTGSTFAGMYQIITFPDTRPVGSYLTYSVWFKQTVGTLRTVHVQIQQNGSPFTIYTSNGVVASALNTWTRVSVSWVSTVSMSSIRFVTIAANPASGDTFFFDGASATESSYPVAFAPRGLDIPDNYIQSAYISSLSADKFTTGTIAAQTITVGTTGYIQSLDWNGTNQGYRLGQAGATFQNGSVTIVGSGGATIIDSTSLRSIIGGSTKFLVNGTGVYIGGDTSANASVYFEGSKTVFQDTSGSYDFIIDTSASKILRLFTGATDAFYLDKTGGAYFAGSIVGSTIDVGSGSTSFHVDINGNMWLGATSFASGTFKVSNAGAVTASTFAGTFVGASTVSPTGTITIGSAPGGTGVLIDTNGIRLYKSGNVTVNLSANTGDGTFTGIVNALEFNTGNSSTGRVRVLSGDEGQINFYNTGNALRGTIGSLTGGIDITATDGSGNDSSINMNNGEIFIVSDVELDIVTAGQLSIRSQGNAVVLEAAAVMTQTSGISRQLTPLFGRSSGALSGSPPTIGNTTTQWYVQAGTDIIGTDGSGFATISFPNAFPGGLLTVMASNGDQNVATYGLVTIRNCSTSSFEIRMINTSTSGTYSSQNVRINWVAYGW